MFVTGRTGADLDVRAGKYRASRSQRMQTRIAGKHYDVGETHAKPNVQFTHTYIIILYYYTYIIIL